MGQDHPPAPPNWARGHACWQGPIRVLEAGSKLNKHHPLGQTRRPVHKSAGPGWPLSWVFGGCPSLDGPRGWQPRAGKLRDGDRVGSRTTTPRLGTRGTRGPTSHTHTRARHTDRTVGSEDHRVPFQSQAPGLTGQTRCCGEGRGRGPREAAPSIRHGDGSQPFQNSGSVRDTHRKPERGRSDQNHEQRPGSRFRTREAEGCLPSASHRRRR